MWLKRRHIKQQKEGFKMKKWILLAAMAVSFYAFGYGYYPIYGNTHYDHGHSYPVCNYHGCQITCAHSLHTCPLLVNVQFPSVPPWIYVQSNLLQICGNQYQMCLWNSNPYNPYYAHYCSNGYYACMGFY